MRVAGLVEGFRFSVFSSLSRGKSDPNWTMCEWITHEVALKRDPTDRGPFLVLGSSLVSFHCVVPLTFHVSPLTSGSQFFFQLAFAFFVFDYLSVEQMDGAFGVAGEAAVVGDHTDCGSASVQVGQ